MLLFQMPTEQLRLDIFSSNTAHVDDTYTAILWIYDISLVIMSAWKGGSVEVKAELTFAEKIVQWNEQKIRVVDEMI